MNAVVTKLLSGRWILTVLTGVVFTWASLQGVLDEAAIAAIVVSVFKDYFSRSDRPPGAAV